MPSSFLRWSLVLLVCLLASRAFAADAKASRSSKATASRPKSKGPRFVRIHGEHRLRSDAAKAFGRMVTSAREDNITLWVTSSYRSRKKQRYLYQLYRKGLGPRAARPGRSNHQRGIAVDLVVGADETSAIYEWLAANACRFGFRRTVPSEPWHWEYRPRSARIPFPGQDCLDRAVAPEPAPPPVASSDKS